MNKIITILIVSLALIGIVSALDITDSDGDGVVDSMDACPNTIADYPSMVNDSFGINRFIWIYGQNFSVRVPAGRGLLIVDSLYTMYDAKGCSCRQIMDAKGMHGREEFGCNKGAIISWING
jgi:hypothetical protein